MGDFKHFGFGRIQKKGAFLRILTMFSVFLIALFSTGCFSVTHDPKASTHKLPTPPESVVFVPIEVPSDSVKAILEQQAKAQPVAQGQTPPLSGTFATEFLINKVRVKTILQAAHDESITSTKSVLLSILTGGASTVTQVTIQHIPELDKIEDVVDTGQNITGEVIKRFSDPISKVIDARYVVHYNCNLGHIETFSMKGDKLYATLVFNWDINADLLTPLPIGFTAKGVLSTKGITAIKTVATISTGDDAKLNISLDSGGTQIEVRSLELPGVGLNLKDIIPLDATTFMTERTLAEVVKLLPLSELGQGIVDKSDNKRALGNKIRESLKKEGRPIALRTNLFLDIAPSRLAFGNITGIDVAGKNIISLPVELNSPVRFVLSSNLPTPFATTAVDTLQITKTAQSLRFVDMQLIADLSLDQLTSSIDTEIQKFWTTNHYLSKGFDIGPIRIWESDGNKFVVRLPIRKKKRAKDWAVIYAWANVHVIEEKVGNDPADCKLKELRLENLNWDTQSKNLFVKELSWLANELLRQKIENSAKLPLDKLEAQLQNYKSIAYDDSMINANFLLKTHKFQDLTARQGYMRVSFHITGEPTLNFK